MPRMLLLSPQHHLPKGIFTFCTLSIVKPITSIGQRSSHTMWLARSDHHYDLSASADSCASASHLTAELDPLAKACGQEMSSVIIT